MCRCKPQPEKKLQRRSSLKTLHGISPKHFQHTSLALAENLEVGGVDDEPNGHMHGLGFRI